MNKTILELFEKAKLIGNNQTLLLQRLLEARGCLLQVNKAYFKQYVFDFENKKLIGKNGFVLQWENTGEANQGSVFLYKEK